MKWKLFARKKNVRNKTEQTANTETGKITMQLLLEHAKVVRENKNLYEKNEKLQNELRTTQNELNDVKTNMEQCETTTDVIIILDEHENKNKPIRLILDIQD